jgi:cell wall-associated NlpC family hydrolase
MKCRIALAVLATPLVALGTAGTASAAQGTYGPPTGLHATKTAATSMRVAWGYKAHVKFLAQARDRGRVVNQFLTWHHYANFGRLKPDRAYLIRIVANQPGARAVTIVVRTRQTFNQRAAAYAMTLRGIPYRWGGTTRHGFDCSGLTQYVYAHNGRRIARMAQDQYNQFRRISHRAARPGDLVFFHQSANPRSYVYHVGVYEGGTRMVAATSSGHNVELQSFTWGGRTVTFGTVSH